MSSQPKDEATGRSICTREQPMPKGSEGRWLHPDAVDVESSCDCCDKYKCPNCGLTFRVELPE